MQFSTETAGKQAAEKHEQLLLSIIDYVRKGIYAERALKADEQGKFSYFKRDGVLAEDDLHRHLNGGPSIAIYPLLEDGMVEVAAFDLDDHAGTFGFDKVCAVARLLVELARDRGLVGWCVRSGGGVGIHIWFFWYTPQSVLQVRQVLGDILASAGLKEGAAGVAEKQVEIIPSSEGFGTAIALPFGRLSVPLGDDLAVVDIQPMWTTSAPIDVVVRAAPVRNQSYALPPFGDVLAALEVIPNDDRDYAIYWRVLAATAASTGMSEEGFEAFQIWSRQSKAKHDEAKNRKKWFSVKEDRSGFGALINLARQHQEGWQPPSWLGVAPYSEQWLALRFVAENAATSRYTAEANRWHHWDGNRWAEDRTIKAFSMAQEICKCAARDRNSGSKGRLLSAKTRAALVSLARENQLVAATLDQWDADPWLLGTPSGVVDLRTGKLQTGDPGAMITMSTVCAPGGGCSLWIKTLGEIFGGDQEVIGYVQRWLGYCLTGSVQEEKFIFAYGTGRNGKGTFWETVRHVLGDYAATVPLATLLAMRQHGHDTEIMTFKGKRLMVANEPNEHDRLDSARIKWFTGGDKLTGRYMRCDPVAFEPTHKLVISGNHPPRFGQVDTALEERINVLGFNAFFDEARRDLTFKARLRDEGSGILAWCVAGCLEWQRQGLNPPLSVRVQSTAMMKEASDLAVFLDEMCQEGVGSTKVPAIFGQWSSWQIRRGRDPGSKKAFTQALVNAGFEVKPGHANVLYVQGLLLLEEPF